MDTGEHSKINRITPRASLRMEQKYDGEQAKTKQRERFQDNSQGDENATPSY